MKTIEYRGGILAFRIPSNWREEYEEDGGGTFYEDNPDTGTLRLNVLTFKAPIGELPASGYKYFASNPLQKGVEIVRLPSGDGMKKYRKDAEEDDQTLHIYYWEISHCAPPQKLYIAVFSWTILEFQSADMQFLEEINMISRELEQVRFHPELGKM